MPCALSQSAFPADLSHMNENNTQAVTNNQVRERAQRLYTIGEWNLAVQLLLELAEGGHPAKAEGTASQG